MTLNWTGERLVTQVDRHYGTFEHLHRYALATIYCANKTVLDIACGEGYGSMILASTAFSVVGVDVSEEAVIHAKSKYVKDNLKFVLSSAISIPLDDASIDLVVSFETLEHLVEHDAFMVELKRVLKPDGLLIMSTPDKSIYNKRDPNNIFHLKELNTSEFVSLVTKYFKHNILLEQRVVVGSCINNVNHFCRDSVFFDGDFEGFQTHLIEEEFFNRAFFNLSIASDVEVVSPPISIFNGYKAYDAEKSELIKRLNYYKSFNDKVKATFVYKLYSFLFKLIFRRTT
jgi:ubiquinone/menaquinone biosynthesis C-methylase UbiE